MKAWSNFLKQLELKLGKETVDQWIKPLRVFKFDAANLYLDATSSFQILWYKEHVTERLMSVNGKPIKLHFYLNGRPYQLRKKKKQLPPPPPIKHHFYPDHLSSHATFSNYIVQESPFLIYDLLSQIDASYNPIFLYGGVGCGKTHLLMATAHMLKEKGKNVFFVRSETFTEHVIRAFRTSSLQEFRLTYRNLDCLIIDDVQLFKKKAATQEELFHTFNQLHTQGKQIVLSGNAPPHLLNGIEERLKSRFEWGITSSLPPTNLDMRKKILEKRAETLSFPLTPSLSTYLLKTFQNLNALIRALEALTLRLHQKEVPLLDLNTTSHLLCDLIEEEERKRLTPAKILQSVSEYFQVQVGAILGKSQSKECVFPRKIAMYFFRTMLKMSYLQIGEYFSRDHSTVISSVKQIKGRKTDKDQAFTQPLLEIQRKLS